jgi:glycine/D-amino acid oxidase-like deaminating enzyme
MAKVSCASATSAFSPTTGAPHSLPRRSERCASHYAWLRRELVRLYPRLDGLEFEAAWTGVVDWSLNGSPSVGRTGKHNNIFYGLGYSGHGVNFTSVFGRIIADLEAGRDNLWKPFPFFNASFDYVPNELFRWLAAQSGLASNRLTES